MMRSSSSSMHSLTNGGVVLPLDFTPTNNTIIIGRGRQVKNHVANKKFDAMVEVIAKEYQAATCKAEKGNILSKLITQVNAMGPDAGFVKKDPVSGRWLQVEESLARTTAAQAIRNHLHSNYRSSKQFKQKRRLQQIRDGIIPTSGTSSSMRRAAAEAQAQLLQEAQATLQQGGRCVSPGSESGEDQEQDLYSSRRNSSSIVSLSTLGNSSSASLSMQMPVQPQQVEDNTFSILFNAFGSASTSEDPFAPTPMKESISTSAAPIKKMEHKEGNASSALAGMLSFKQLLFNDNTSESEDVFASILTTSNTDPISMMESSGTEGGFDARFTSLLSQIQPSSSSATAAV